MRRDGLIPVYLDTLKGKRYLEVVSSGEDLLLVPASPTGLGSNDVGLDRRLVGEERIVQFRRTRSQNLLYAPLFDPMAPADAAARRVFDLLLQPERLHRLRYQALQDPSLPSLSQVLEQVSQRVWATPMPEDPYNAHLQRVVQTAC